MPSQILRSVCVTALLLAPVASPWVSQPRAQCSNICGDLNGSGNISTAEGAILLQYYQSLDWGPFDSTCADVDNSQGFTVRDFSFIIAEALAGAPPMTCPPDSGTYVPVLNADHFLHYNHVIPPGDTILRVYFSATIPNISLSVGLGYDLEVSGVPATIESIGMAVPGGWDWGNAWAPQQFALPPSYLFTRMFHFDPIHSAPAGTYDLCTLDVSVPLSTEYQLLSLEPAEWPPGDNTPMVVQRNSHTGWALNFDPLTVVVTGDADNDRMVTSSDVIKIVNFVFKGGPTPYPVPAAGDVNCSGEVTSSDLITLVNFVFKGGAAPCDVETECTINLDQWSCP